jgi:hypothetical protein
MELARPGHNLPIAVCERRASAGEALVGRVRGRNPLGTTIAQASTTGDCSSVCRWPPGASDLTSATRSTLANANPISASSAENAS